MKQRLKSNLFIYLLLTVVACSFTSCFVSREDMYKLALIKAIPDIEVLGYPNGLGNYDFGPVEVYTTGFTTFTIQNTGTGKLRISAISFVEEDASWFTIDTSSISSIISPDGSTTFTIKFKPTITAYKSVTVIILSDDEDESPYTFTVEGSGFGTPLAIPDINVKQGSVNIPNGYPSPVDFGSVEVGASGSKPFSIENDDTGELSIHDIYVTPGGGTAAGEFSVIAPSIPAVLSEGDSNLFTIRFSPKTTGTKSATVTILNDDPDENPYAFAVQGDGSAIPYPDINIMQGINDLPNGSGSYDFGYVKCNTSSLAIPFTVENMGTAVLNISNVTITSGDPLQFVIDTTPMVFSISPGSSTTFSITFKPNSIEEYKSAVVTVSNNDPDECSYTFQVEGWGVTTPVPDINIVEAIYDSVFDFGPVLLGSSKTERFTIENLGTADLSITAIKNKDPDKFSLDYSTVVSPISPGGGSTYFLITFTPLEDNERTATIEIHSNDPDEGVFKFKVTAYGSAGKEPDIDVKQGNTSYPDGSEFYFPDTVVGSSSVPVTFTIKNNGTSELVILSLLLDGGDVEDFGLDYDPDALTLSPGDTFIITIWFKPIKDKTRDTKLKIRSNDPNEEKYEIKLKGKGIKQ